MRADKLQEQVRRQPFQPFRMHLTSGTHFDVHHPEFILVTRRDVVVAKLVKGEPLESILIDPIHITHVESLNGPKKQPLRKRPRGA